MQTTRADGWCAGGAQVEELPADLFEFHEIVSHMQEVEEAVVDAHRDFYDVSCSLTLFIRILLTQIEIHTIISNDNNYEIVLTVTATPL